MKRVLPGLIVASIVVGAVAMAEDPRSVSKLSGELRRQQVKAGRLEDALEVERQKAYDVAQRLEAAGVWCHEFCATPDVTADVSVEQFLNAVNCAWDCQDDPVCNGPMSSDDTLEILLTTCGLGWHQAQELMIEGEYNYAACQRELSWLRDDGWDDQAVALRRASVR